MEENLRRNIPSLDSEAMAGCGSELVRTNSDASGLSVDMSKDSSLAHNADARPGTSTVWTDEKHRLYIESLETSFINQLPHSICSRRSLQEVKRGPPLNCKMPDNGGSYSHQFMVLQDGCWQRVNFARKEPLLESTADSNFIQSNPWIRHFRPSGRQHNSASHGHHEQSTSSKRNCVRNSTIFGELARSSGRHPECCPRHQLLADNKREVSDQNFMNEDQRDRSSCFPVLKRLKVGANATANDQVVPSGKSSTRDVSSGIPAFAGTEEAGGSGIADRRPG